MTSQWGVMWFHIPSDKTAGANGKQLWTEGLGGPWAQGKGCLTFSFPCVSKGRGARGRESQETRSWRQSALSYPRPSCRVTFVAGNLSTINFHDAAQVKFKLRI